MTDARRAIEHVLPGDWFWMDSDPDHPLCRMLDRQGDIDAVVVRTHGPVEFVSWREQPTWLFDTMTLRYATDRGNRSQWQKIISGRSSPSWYAHGYGMGADVYGWMIERSALRDLCFTIAEAGRLDQYLQGGSAGQQFVTLPAELLVRATAVRWGVWPTRRAA